MNEPINVMRDNLDGRRSSGLDLDCWAEKMRGAAEEKWKKPSSRQMRLLYTDLPQMQSHIIAITAAFVRLRVLN